MNKKLIAISIVIIFILVTFLPTVSASNKSNDDPHIEENIILRPREVSIDDAEEPIILKELLTNPSIFGLGYFINILYDVEANEDPISPREAGRVINLSIEYGIVSSGRLISSLILWFYRHKEVDIKLEIVDKPPWCDASLSQEILSVTVSDKKQNSTTFLSIKVGEDAPAYGPGAITINASIDDIKGLFGLTRISGVNKQFTIPFTPGYLPLIKPEFPLGIEISPYNETRIPINITNLGNGKTKVLSEIDNCSDAWEVVIDEDVIIDVGDTKTIYLKVKADHKFDEETVKLKFTPTFAEGPDIGESQYATLIFINDGSYKEEEPGIEIDTTILVIIIAIIIIISVLLLLLKRRK